MKVKLMSKTSLAVLKIPDFRILVLTRLCGTMALQAQAVIVGWQLYSLTHSTLLLGLLGLAEAVPALLCALVAGHIVDNSRPYTVFSRCIIALIATMVMLWSTVGGLIALSTHSVIAILFIGVFCSGIARSFIIPSSFALQPQIVPRIHIPSASAWLTSAFQLGIIGGPALAGFAFAFYGAKIAWCLPLSLMSIEAVLVLLISKPNRLYYSNNKRESHIASIKAGWKFIGCTPLLLCVMALDMFAVLFGGAVSILPAYADTVLHSGAESLGWLRAAPAMGAVIITVLYAVRPLQTVQGKKLLIMVSGFGLCMIMLGLSHHFWFAWLWLALSGAFDSVSMIIRQTLVQWLTPGSMRGRVSSVNSMFVISSNEIGAFESGLSAQMFGVAPSIVFGGIGTLIVVAITYLFYPALASIQVVAHDAVNGQEKNPSNSS